jgi:hypothetical protein
MLFLPPYTFSTAASKPLTADAQISGLIPSPSIKGMIGFLGTLSFPVLVRLIFFPLMLKTDLILRTCRSLLKNLGIHLKSGANANNYIILGYEKNYTCFLRVYSPIFSCL